MEALIYLDTHVLLWLYEGELDRLSATARESIEENELRISPMVLLELEFLHEVGRSAVQAAPIFESLHRRIALQTCELKFADTVRSALPLDWTRDPFDRIIVAQAMLASRPLLTKDRTIRRRYPAAVW